MGRLAGLVLVFTMALAAAAGAQPRIVGSELAAQEAGVLPGEQQLIPELYGGAMPRRAEPPLVATPRATCGPGSRPAPGLQGRVTADLEDGATCNTELLASEGATGGFKVERYRDAGGHECAYYDTALLFPLNLLGDVTAGSPSGVAVLDMADPAHPKRTATLTTPAMLSPHESLLVNAKRGLLAAALGNPGTAPGVVDVYDLNADCRFPVLQSSTPLGVLGHESGFAPDGRTFYVTSLFTNTITALDVSDPKQPSILWLGNYPSHALTVSADGRRGYVAGFRGLQVLDLSEIQDRRPNPQVRLVSGLSWKGLSIPQNAIPVTIGGKPMLIETDEFSYDDDGVLASNGANAGAARIIDMSDENAPRVLSNLRLEVNQRENRAAVSGDPGATFIGQGYAAHYCGVPSAVDPGIVACSFIASGLRIFDIRDPANPRELAYYAGPPKPIFGAPGPAEAANYAMSRPAFDPASGTVWYSDANAGLRVVRLTNGVWPFPATSPVGLPSTRTCLSRRAFTIRLRGAGLRSARVTVGGRAVAVRRRGGRLTARVDLRGTRRATVPVTVRARTRGGRVLRETRRYRTCRG